MAILTPPHAARGLRRRTLALGSSAGVALMGCAAVAYFTGGTDVAVFSHQVHVVEQGLDCAMCHMTEDGATRPLPPDLGQCALCHDSLDADKPEHRRAAAFFVAAPGAPADAAPVLRAGLPRYSSEVRFDHTAHAALLGDDCLACHVGMDQSAALRLDDALSMRDCTECHERSGRADTCSVCHTELDLGVAPPNHVRDWLTLHGEASRDPHPPTASDCALCHSQASCTECHQSTPPASHDEHFRLRGHGVLADLSRESCMTCHRSDSCIQCHESTRPLSHHGAFGSPLNNHCVGCHFPLAGEGCATCHRGTPSHASAAPQPGDHVPGANCRLCHGAGAPLPHVDDGSACALCHR